MEYINGSSVSQQNAIDGNFKNLSLKQNLKWSNDDYINFDNNTNQFKAYINNTPYIIAPTTPGGTVTSIIAGTGLTGGTITSSGTIALSNTTVAAASYTNANITVDAQGRITNATNGINNLALGEGYITSAINNTSSSGVNYRVITLNRGIMQNTNLNGPDNGFSTDSIIIQVTGIYHIIGWMDIRPANNSTIITSAIGLNGNPIAKSTQQLNIANKDEERLFNINIFANLSAGNTISLLYNQTGQPSQILSIDRAYISVQLLNS